ncbi:MAG: hypothetical protein ACLP75_11085 [Mycobacterium sp.]|uniref:hypothetical protein n=1 Tax=Mycobacterium sp. TaxID=1785 RepID=UPI003F9D9BA0
MSSVNGGLTYSVPQAQSEIPSHDDLGNGLTAEPSRSIRSLAGLRWDVVEAGTVRRDRAVFGR